jgi:hypothetical protein
MPLDTWELHLGSRFFFTAEHMQNTVHHGAPYRKNENDILTFPKVVVLDVDTYLYYLRICKVLSENIENFGLQKND